MIRHFGYRRPVPGRKFLTFIFVAFVSLIALVPTANAAMDEPAGLEAEVDRIAGVLVDGLGSVLFYPLGARSRSAQVEGVATTDVDIRRLVERIEATGLDTSEASLSLKVPYSVSDAEVEALNRQLSATFVPSSPKGIRRFTVVRGAKGEDATTLTANKGGIPIVALWLLIGAVFFTIRMGFINIRAFGHAIAVVRGHFDRDDDEGEVSHFQALASALSATVGLGNIAGVAIAVAMGGPGAVFWLIVAGVFGMSSKFVECTLGQKYRQRRSDGQVLGGPMFYLSRGLSERGLGGLGQVLAVLFAILCIGGSLGGGNSFQVSQSLDMVQESYPAIGNYRWAYGLVMAGAVGVVILGGIKRIAATAEKIVPLMCGVYVVACLYLLAVHVTDIPMAFARIVGEAFTPAAGYGGFAGVLVTGLRRAAFSNEAGVGSAAIAHSAAKTDYPVREGIVALLEPFIDTVVVCTMTGLVIVVTGAYEDPANYDLIAGGSGAALTSRAMGGEISWFPWVLMVAVILFAYSTMISWSYYGERCWVFLFGDRASLSYRILFLVFVFLGSIVTATKVMEFGDLMIMSMAFPNILGLYILSGSVKKDLDTYLGKLDRGEFEPSSTS